jgi:phage-related minor tail protein
MKLDFSEIQRIAKEGLSDTWNQAGEDFKNLWKILTDTSNAPETYTNKIKGLAAQLDKTFGGSMRAKLDAFTTEMNDFGGMVADVVVKSFKGLEDQLVSFVTTGKLEFRKLAQSIIADMARIAIRATIIKPIMAGFGLTAAKGAVLENGQHLTAYAKGGIVNKPTIFPMANGMGLMGEAGPEAVMPLKRGKGGRLGVEATGGGTNVVVNVDASGSEVQGSDEQGRVLGKLIAAAINSTLIKEKRPGGLLAA